MRQAEIVAALVRSWHPEVAVEINTVASSGDRDARPFGAIGGKGLFTAEIEKEVVEGRADVAVHSAKDLTSELAPGCSIACVTERASAHDVIVGGEGDTGEERIAALSPGARVGTSSMRRRALMAEARPDVDVVEFRGNLDTRLAKVEAGEVDVAILAAAGVERLTDDAGSVAQLDPTWWVPAPGQGALAVEAQSDRDDLIALFAALSHPASAAEIACERSFASTLEGGCSVPLGCLARSDSGRLVVTGFLGAPDGSQGIRDRISGSVDDAEALGAELADAILSAGGADILADLRGEIVSEPAAP